MSQKLDQAQYRPLILRLISGIQLVRVQNRLYSINSPDLELKMRAEEYTSRTADQLRFDIPTRNRIIVVLKQRGIIPVNMEEQLKTADKTIEDLKCDLFLCYGRKSKEDEVRKTLQGVRRHVNDIYKKLNGPITYSLEYILDQIKSEYILWRSIYYKNKRIRPDIKLFNTLSYEINGASLSIEDLRALSRSYDWRSLWSLYRERIFRASPAELNDEQTIIASFSRTYDSAIECSDFPGDIIDDDDKFDGWMIYKQRAAKEAQKEDIVESTIANRSKKYDEVFITAKNQDEANEIYELNNQKSRQILNERAQVIQDKGLVTQFEFSDVRTQQIVQGK